ncbi:TonB-dependent receptor [Rhodocyclus purpureus]|uniref:TonB-dependent receptor n=1 Tax=Rhodocyclus purpureus TaxID=1067 RepID=UPI001913BA08|nr:TonB-dependent siderophore receptor [Rhodocyclus purpureus]MBK5915400.1 TonB-dependent siderophore receptor [Rhodocyclus purpureus]
MHPLASAPRRAHSPLQQLTPLAVLITTLYAGHAQAQSGDETTRTLPTLTVEANAESADGPVQGYRATRSATFTRTDTPLKDIPASVQVVPVELMRDQAMSSMGDVLRYVPGTLMGQGEGNRDQPVLRGINTTSDFFVDGVRDDAMYQRDLYNLERVEVLKGPGGMAFGRGGAGGVVNRVTKRADFQTHSDVNLTLGSEGQRRGSFDAGARINDAASWRITGMGEDSDSFRDFFSLRRQAINPTVTLTPGPDTLLTLGYEYLNDERTADRGIPSENGRPFQTSRGQFFGSPQQNISKNTVNGVYALLEHQLGDGLQFRNNFRVTQYEKFYQNVYASSAVNAADNLTLSAYNQGIDRLNFFNQSDLIARFVAGGLEHTLLTGIEIGRQENDSYRNDGRFNGNKTTSVAASSPYANASWTLSAHSRSTADLFAAYVQDQIALNKQWKVTAGLRYDSFRVNFNDQFGSNDLARTDSKLSPRLGLVYQPTGTQTYYASYSYSFLPSGDGLTLATNNAELGPEEALNYEVGARWDLNPRLTLSTSVFRTDRDKVKTRDPGDPTKLALSGLQRTEGVEASLQGEVRKNWQIYAGFALLDARTETAIGGSSTSLATPAGARVALVPKQAASIWNKFDLGGGWGLGFGLVHQAEVYTSLSNAVKLPSFVRADGALYYRFADNKTRLALNIENLFDKKYYPTAHNDNNISVGAPRTAMLSLSTRF